jgi:hypothetical protein
MHTEHTKNETRMVLDYLESIIKPYGIDLTK